MIWLGADFASNFWQSFHSDYFDFLFFCSLRLGNTTKPRGNGRRYPQDECDQSFTLRTSSTPDKSTPRIFALRRNLSFAGSIAKQLRRNQRGL